MINKKYLFSFIFAVIQFLDIGTFALFIKGDQINRADLNDLNLLDDNLIDEENTLILEFEDFLRYLADNIDENPNNLEKNLNSIEILSDTKSRNENIFIAEGNVFARKNNFLLKADKLIFDFNKNILIVEGNINFKVEDQFLEGSEIIYDFSQQEGHINDAYGTINLDNLSLLEFDSDSQFNESEDVFDDITVKNVIANNYTNLNGNELNELGLDLNRSQIWRFQSEKILIKNNNWEAEKLFLTNDPFNETQLIIVNSGFKIINENGILFIKSRWSSLFLDNIVSLPIGPIRYSISDIDGENNFKWGIEYDGENRDGLVITRSLGVINFFNEETNLYINKEFYIQRIINGKTKSFSQNGESVLAAKTEQDIIFSDYFGIDARLVSKIYGLDFYSDFKLNSLDFKKFNKIINLKSELSKTFFKENLINSNSELKLSLFGIYRESVWNGSLGWKEILSAYGLKIEKTNIWLEGKTTKTSIIALNYGDYQSSSRIDEDNIINRKRLNLYLERKHRYSLWKFNRGNNFIDNSYLYSPTVISPGIDLIARASIDFYGYDDDNYQKLFLFRIGPELVFGEYKKRFLDYTKLSIFAKTTISDGNSPFGFDQSVDNHAIEIDVTQQFFGPLTIRYSTEYNLDINSTEYHQFHNQEIELAINRRAYDLALFYNFETETGGLNFIIHSFSFDGMGNKFIDQ